MKIPKIIKALLLKDNLKLNRILLSYFLPTHSSIPPAVKLDIFKKSRRSQFIKGLKSVIHNIIRFVCQSHVLSFRGQTGHFQVK